MTDREKLLALLTDWGVGFNEERAKRERSDLFDPKKHVILHEGDSKIEGYSDFYAVFEFEPDGSFSKISVWE